MSRPKTHRTLRLERLESREVMTAAGGPSAQAQYMLELINLARTNPSQMASQITQEANSDPNVMATLNHYGISLSNIQSDLSTYSSQPPLAWSDALGASATQQSQYEATNGIQTHQGPGEASTEQRMEAAGYSNRSSDGENSYAYSSSVDEAMEAFLIDWGVSDNGHRNNLLQPGVSADNAYRDVGIGIVNSTGAVGPMVITQDFGSQNSEKAQLVGVAFNDPNHTNFYAPGQGRGDVTISATEIDDASGNPVANGPTVSQDTWASGGYEIPLDPGTYKVSASVGGQVINSQNVTIGTTNVEVDYNLTALSQSSGSGSGDQGGSPSSSSSSAPANNVVMNPAANWDPSWDASWASWTAKQS